MRYANELLSGRAMLTTILRLCTQDERLMPGPKSRMLEPFKQPFDFVADIAPDSVLQRFVRPHSLGRDHVLAICDPTSSNRLRLHTLSEETRAASRQGPPTP
jgi:hypothetical protein